MSVIVVGSFIMISCNACLAKAFIPSALPFCSIALGTVKSISGQAILITPEQGNTTIHAKYSNDTHILKEEVVDSSALERGRHVQVLAPAASNEAGVVSLYPSNDTQQSLLLGCQMPQTTQNPAITPSGSGPIPSQGIIQQVTNNNTFTISLRTGQLKTFTWSVNTPFTQYTDQSSKILSPGTSVLLIGPMRNGVIMASRIAVLPRGQVKASFKAGANSCAPFLGPSLCSLVLDLGVLGILAHIFI
jgi:hypothetical protein